MENITDIDFGLRIKELIESRGVTITDGAKLLSYSRQNFTDILNKRDVSTSVLKKICDQFGVGMEYFLKSDAINISQEGNANMVGNGKISYKVSERLDTDSKIIAMENKLNVTENENLHLKEQIKLLKEMIELLKPKPQ